MLNEPDRPVDHLFGDVDQAPKGSAFVMTRHVGAHHWGSKSPAIPQPGESVRLQFTHTSELCVTTMKVAFSTDEWQTSQTLEAVQSAHRWDTALWRWISEWEATLPAQAEGVMLRYQVWAELAPTSPNEPPRRVYADNQATVPDKASQFAIWYSDHRLPAWAKDARVYQIFLDRFYPGDGKAWTQTLSLTQPMGGTLRGVIDKLEHIEACGFNAIWLSPIFKSPTHHGYDTSDYEQIEPRFGTLADFNELIKKAHQRGIRIILDFVANHVSSSHPLFQKALTDANSPAVDWFLWSEWPKFQAFYEVQSMPQLNLAYGSPARAHLLWVAQKWLRLGVDGYRLDYAAGPEPDFWVDFRRACEIVNPLCWTFGEVVASADVQLSFAGGMHGTLDFLTCQALRETIARQAWPLSRLIGYLENSAKFFPEGFSRPAFIDNHDMNRFLFTAGGDTQLLEIALSLLYSLPQPVIVYAGSETALNHPRSIHQHGAVGFDESRVPMNWVDTNRTSSGQNLFKELTNLRQKLSGFAPADRTIWFVDDEKQTAVWLWKAEGIAVLALAINLSDQAQLLSLPKRINADEAIRLPAKTCLILEPPPTLN